MPAGTNLEYFGDHRQDPRVEERLPQDLTFGKVLYPDKPAMYHIPALVANNAIPRRGPRMLDQNR